MKARNTLAAAATVAIAASSVIAAPASAHGGSRGGGDGVVRLGACAGSTHWKLKASPDDGRIEVEGEVDSNRSGQLWRWRIVHDGSVSAHGRSSTAPPSGSFEVRRLLVNLAGRDTITLWAHNRRSGETCRGTVHI